MNNKFFLAAMVVALLATAAVIVFQVLEMRAFNMF